MTAGGVGALPWHSLGAPPQAVKSTGEAQLLSFRLICLDWALGPRRW